jgi:8-oxo-dGTP pyrophosphatase MutT (NUDIX family)
LDCVNSTTNADLRRCGAVLIPIFANAPHNVIFVERARHLRRNPGQIGFPGGVEDPVDGGDPVKTALREFSEELGAGAESVDVVGSLPPLEQASSRLVITPIVGVLDAATRFSLDGEEIAAVLAVPMAAIVAEDGIYDDVERSKLRGRTMYAFDYQGHHIWGFTARVLKSFIDAVAQPQALWKSSSGNPLGLPPLFGRFRR